MSKSLCAQFHAWEKWSGRRVLKLKDAWEPTPFPAELPLTERAQRRSRPAIPTPNLGYNAPSARGAAPDQVSEVRFACGVLRRKGGVVMVVALKREEAEERHRTRQHYALATRLSEGQMLIVVRHCASLEADNAIQPRWNYVPTRAFHLQVYGERGLLLTSILTERFESRGVLEM